MYKPGTTAHFDLAHEEDLMSLRKHQLALDCAEEETSGDPDEWDYDDNGFYEF